MILLQKRKQKIIELVTRPGLEQVYRVPKYVAGVLELPQSERYTGLSFAGTTPGLGTLPEPADISDMSESEPEPEDPLQSYTRGVRRPRESIVTMYHF